jgi:hypothetical protein
MSEEKKTYWAIYICLNCGTERWESIDLGESMPIFVKNIPSNPIFAYGMKLAPECKYCGCRSWSRGKKPTS